MIVVEQSRMDAVRVLREYIATEGGRSMLSRNGYESGTPIVPASEADQILTVMSRVRATGALRVALAVHFPLRSNALEFVELRPVSEPAPEHFDARGQSTIGMLVDALSRTPGRTTFSVSASVVAHHFDLQAVC